MAYLYIESVANDVDQFLQELQDGHEEYFSEADHEAKARIVMTCVDVLQHFGVCIDLPAAEIRALVESFHAVDEA